jgi:hypothetical protein
MSKYRHFPPQQNHTHLSEFCRNPNCVFGFIDWFDADEKYITTTVCAVCKPDTFDYLRMFPNVGQRTEAVLNAMQRKREEIKKKGLRDGF